MNTSPNPNFESTHASGSLGTPIKGGSTVHRRQFLMGPEPVLIRSNWIICELSDGCYLTHCPTLPVHLARDSRGVPVCLLGLAVQTDAVRANPMDELRNADPQELEQLTVTWAGRWMLITHSELTMDASGLFGCFFRTGKGRERWISSSPVILANLPGKLPCKPDSRRLRHGFGIEWYTPPRSGFDAVQRLLPSQRLHLNTGQIRPKALMATAIRSLSYPQILDKLQSILVTGILNASPANAALWIQLTAGIDSRLLLAATALTRIPTKTVTLDYRWIERGDLELPPQLAAAVGLPHTLINRGSFSKHLAGQYDDHTGGHHPEADREFYARNQMNWAQEKDVVLRGGCFHVARSFYWHLFGQHDRPDPNLFANAFVEDPRSSGVTGLCEWFEWAAQNPQAGLDWRDRLYWEQRLAGWLSSNEQALDLCKFESHNPINSAEALGLLLSVPLEIRRRGQHHKDLIERMAPELLKFPFNPPDSRLRRCVGWAVGIAPRLVDPRYSLRLIKRKISK